MLSLNEWSLNEYAIPHGWGMPWDAHHPAGSINEADQQEKALQSQRQPSREAAGAGEEPS